MKHRTEHDGRMIVSLERGDALRASVEGLATRAGVVGAELSAIGAVEDPELGYYDLDAREYVRRTFPGRWELASFLGNLTLKERKPFLHAHVVISGRDFAAFGGHLFDAKVAVVVELFLRPLPRPLSRFECEEIGLARWEPDRA